MKLNKSNSYKAPLYLELHRFKATNWRKGINRGFELSLAELRALTAITILLAQNDYEGEDHELITLKDWKSFGETPILSCKWNQYLDAYYGEEGKGRKGQQAERAKKALIELSEKQLKLSYYRKTGDPVINCDCKLVTMIKDRQATRSRDLTLVFHPIFIDNIHNFYILKSPNLFNQICHEMKIQKPKKQLILFIEWLLTKNNSPTEISENNLIERIWLDPLRLARKRAAVRGTLQECFEVAVGLGYLCEFPEKRTGNSKDNKVIFSFKPNPDLCSRIGPPRDQ